MFRRTFPLLIIFLLSACVTPYVPPVEGPMAMITLPESKSSYQLIGGMRGTASRLAYQDEGKCGKFYKIEEGLHENVAIAVDKKVFFL